MSGKTRAQLRELVRNQLDLDAEELPNTTLDPWLEDAFERTLDLEDRWPFLEYDWTMTTTDTVFVYPKAALAAADPNHYEVEQITTLLDITDNTPVELSELAHARAQREFDVGGTTSGVPAYFSQWANSIYIWPAPNVRNIRISGYRKPLWADGDGVQPDCDTRLHIPLFYFACAVAYDQQEDDAMSAEYMRHWRDAASRAQTKIMAKSTRTIILGRGLQV
jgi:hypothetical protein